MEDELVKWLSPAASVATIAAVIFLVRQIQIGIRQARLASDTFDVGVQQVKIAQAALDDDRKERAEHRRQLRETLWQTLRTEVTSILTGANSNLARLRPVNHGNPDEEAAFRDQEVKGELAYNRSFVWAPISISTLEQILGQLYLLNLGTDSIQVLHSLRLQVLKANSLAAAKTALLPNLVQGEVPSRQPSLHWHRWAEMEADQLNVALVNGSHQICNTCREMMKVLPPIDTERNLPG